MVFDQVRQRRLSDDIVDRLEGMILEGTLTSGQRLPAERVLAEPGKELLQAGQQPLEKTPRIAVTLVQAQPQALPALRQRFAELDRQGAFAKPCRCADQQQAPGQTGHQPFAQTRTRYVTGGQGRAVKVPPYRRAGSNKARNSEQISHRPVLVAVRQQHYQCSAA